MSDQEKIYVTRPSLPELEKFIPYLEDIWQNRWLTNDGKYHKMFESELAAFLGVKYVSLFCNGTLALQTGLQAMRITGEVITTPFSFVATTHAIYWNRCKPVFCDIDPKTYCLDAEKVKSLISPQTTAILPVHVYGYPCDVDKLKSIADIYGLKLFYDAAHAFGETYRGNSLISYGDLTMLSFHATKVFTTFEGGALCTNDEKLKQRIDFLKNFGIADETTVVAPGSNGKMNEFSAALGMLQLQEFPANIRKRKVITDAYTGSLQGMSALTLPPVFKDFSPNCAYYPVVLATNALRNTLFDRLREHNIISRRYFYPLISEFPAYRGEPSATRENLPVAHDISSRILCLPIYPDLPLENVERICNVVKSVCEG